MLIHTVRRRYNIKKKKEKTISKVYIYASAVILTVLWIYLGYIIYSLLYTYPKYTVKIENISDYTPLVSTYIKPSVSSIEILPTNFVEFVNTYNLDITQEHRVAFLNNGYFFIPILEMNESQEKVANLYRAYTNLSSKKNKIYISSNSLSYYFDYKYFQLRNFLSKEESTKRYTYDNSTTQNSIDSNIDITIEDNKENYTYIATHLGYISQHFPVFNNLRKDISVIQEYIENQKKKDVINIIKQLPTVYLKEDEQFGYIISLQNNSLIIYPDIVKSDSIYSLDNQNFSKDYDIQPVQQATGSVRIPVLMYHQIECPPEGISEFKRGLYMTPELFEKQIAYLTKKNYKSITTQEFFEIIQSGQNPSQKTVLLTFDDSTVGHFTNAYPILNKYGHTGVFFVPSSRSSINATQLKEISDNGMDIQSHSSTHPDLSKITDISVLQTEIGGSKIALESITGKSVNAFAYPGCVGNSTVFNMVSSSGYNLGFSCGKTIDHFFQNRFVLSRRHAPNDMEYFVKTLSGIF